MTDSNFTQAQRQELDQRQRELGHGEPPFTDEQLSELELRAEERDQRRPRNSRFSIGEQHELDEAANAIRLEGIQVARTLEFNEIQKAELSHRFNKIEAKDLARFSKIIWLSLLTMVVLIAVIYGCIMFNSLQRQVNRTNANMVALCHHQSNVSCSKLFK